LSEEIVNTTSINDLFGKVMLQARDLVHAERASLFLVKKEAGVLTTIFADGGDMISVPHNEGTCSVCGLVIQALALVLCGGVVVVAVYNVRYVFVLLTSLSIYITNTHTTHTHTHTYTGLVGHVLHTKEKINVAEAHTDARFTGKVDANSGFRTRSVLCLPVMDPHTQEVVAVMQMINKLGGAGSASPSSPLSQAKEGSAGGDGIGGGGGGHSFTTEDEELLEALLVPISAAVVNFVREESQQMEQGATVAELGRINSLLSGERERAVASQAAEQRAMLLVRMTQSLTLKASITQIFKETMKDLIELVGAEDGRSKRRK
jgi:GAF domain-containing protein